MESDRTVTQLLQASQSGDEAARDDLILMVYEELHQMARQHLRGERPSHTLQPTALVNEVYMRLFNGEPVEIVNRRHFFSIAATQMRRILVDHARRKGARKRRVEEINFRPQDLTGREYLKAEEMLALDEALSRFRKIYPRGAKIVELRYFLGLTEEETAEVVDVSLSTVKREWIFARTWLLREMTCDSVKSTAGKGSGAESEGDQ